MLYYIVNALAWRSYAPARLPTVYWNTPEISKLYRGDDLVVGSAYPFLQQTANMNKRGQSFVRFGKRAQSFVRFGRSSPSEVEKRGQSFVRFG